MATTYTHKEMLIACEDGDNNTLEDCLKQGLPVNGHPLKESPLWALSIGFDDKVDDAELDLDYYVNKFDCFISLVPHVDFSEYDYAALKNIHQQNSLFESGVIHYLEPKDVLNVFAFTPPENQLLIAAAPPYAEHFCSLIDKHLAGEVHYDNKSLREAFANISVKCADGTEEQSILMAKKMIDNGLGLTKAEGDYIHFFNIISSNYKKLLGLVIDSGELDGFYNDNKSSTSIEILYSYQSIQEYHHENGALYQLLSTLSKAELHDLSSQEIVLDHDNAGLVKRLIIEKELSNTLRLNRSRLSL